MQIGSATSYVAPVPLSLAARPPSSDISPSGASDKAPGSARDQATEADESARAAREQRAEQQEIAELASRDSAVRAHEQAHAAVGGAYAGAPSYTFARGPDGKRYAVGGEVRIDTSTVPDDPEATLRKMELVQRAALAPVDPSAQDRSVAAQATAAMAEAQAGLAQQRRQDAAAAAEERAAQREERQASEAESDKEQSPAAPAPRLDLYLRLAQLQAPVPTVDLQA